MTHGKDPRTWDQYVADVQLGINSTVHDVTKNSPTELLFGLKVINPSQGKMSDIVSDAGHRLVDKPLDDIRSEAESLIQHQNVLSKNRNDTKRKVGKQFNVGDLVKIIRTIPSTGQSRKLEPKLQGPYRILKVLPNDRYLVEDTPLSRKGRRYEAIIAIDKLYPWLNFGNPGSSDSE